MLNTIYETGYDLHVANYVAYLHTDKKLYEDEAHKVQAKKADVEKAFKLGRLIVVAADKTYLPVALVAAGVVVTDGTTPTTCSHGCGRGLIFSGFKVSHNKSKWSEKR